MKNKTNLIAISGKAGSGKSTVGLIIQLLLCQKKLNITNNFISQIVLKKENTDIKQLEFDSKWQIKQFSTKLKEIISILTGIPINDLEKQEVKDKVLGEEWWKFDETVIKNWLLNFYTRKEIDEDKSILLNNYKNSPKGIEKPTVRELLQTLGTNLLREQLHLNIFINALFADYREKVDFDNNLPMNKNWIITDLRFKNEKKAIEDRGGITIRVNRPKVCIAELSNGKKRLATPEEIEKYPEHISETELDNQLFTYTIDNNGSIEDLIESVKEILIKEKLIS